MTKKDIVTKIASQVDLTQQQIAVIVQKTLDTISEGLAQGEKFELRNFGVFQLDIHKQRIGRNPNKPEKNIVIPERTVVKFKPGKELIGAVSKLAAKNIK